MRFSLLSVFPFELNKGIIYLYYFLTLLLVLFTGQLNAQTDGCPWAGEDQSICSGECVIIGCEEAQNDGACLTWEPTIFISEGYPPHSAMIEVCPTETTTYTIYITNAEGDLIATDEVTVFVEPPRLEIAPNPAVICPGEMMTLTAIVENSNSPSYLWSNGETTESINITPEQTSIYEVTVTDEDTGCVLEETFVTSVYYMPDIEIHAVFPSICELQDVGLTSPNAGSRFSDCDHNSTMLFTDNNPNNTYLWSTGATIFYTYAHTVGTYSVTVTNPDGCERVASYEVTSCEEVDISPDIEVNNNGENITILDAGASYASYEWSDGSTGQTLEIDNPGDYAVTVVTEGGCVSRAETNIEACGEFAAFLILHTLDDEHRKQNIFISNSSQFAQGDAAFTADDRALIKNYINENRARLGIQSTPSLYETEYYWVCNEMESSCLVESNEEHLILKNQGTGVIFSSLIVKKNIGGEPEFLLNCLAGRNYKFYTSVLEVVEITNSETPSSMRQRITPQIAENSAYSELNDFLISPNMNEFTAQLTVQTAIGEYNNITDDIAIPTGIVIDMTVKFHQEEDPIEYVITHNGQVVIEPISADEGTQLVFGLARVDDDTGELIAVNNIGEEGVNTLNWNQGGVNPMEGVATYIYTVPQFEEEGGTDILTLGVNFNDNLEATIIPLNVLPIPGFHHDESPNASMIAPKSSLTLMDYVECARMRIETEDNDEEDYDTYSTLFGEDSDLSVRIHLYGSTSDDRSGYAEAVVNDITGLLILDEGSINAPPYDPGCPTIADPDNLLLKKISQDEENDIRAIILDLDDNHYIPDVVNRINAYDPVMGAQLIEWCNYDANSGTNVEEINREINENVFTELSELRTSGQLLYRPTELELDEWIQVPESADVYLNYEKLNYVPDYGRLTIYKNNTMPPLIHVNMDQWYSTCGVNVNPDYSGYSNSTATNPSQFEEDLDEFRCRKYTNVLAHELGHIKQALVNKKEKFIWNLIRDAYKSTHYIYTISDNPCFPARVGNTSYCSRGYGHELGNPDNFTSCESVISDWEDFKIVHYQ